MNTSKSFLSRNLWEKRKISGQASKYSTETWCCYVGMRGLILHREEENDEDQVGISFFSFFNILY